MACNILTPVRNTGVIITYKSYKSQNIKKENRLVSRTVSKIICEIYF